MQVVIILRLCTTAQLYQLYANQSRRQSRRQITPLEAVYKNLFRACVSYRSAMALTRSGLVVSTQNSASTDLPQHPLLRTADFWRRVSAIYLGYKVAKVKATYLSWRGHSQEEIKQIHWQSIHEKAGQDMYQLCVDMRGFLIKVLIYS